jgi:hypothetical protein
MEKKMSNESSASWIGGFFGVIVGLMIAAVLIHLPISVWVNQGKLLRKETISMPGCYAQYSAVRRFPK